jgi:hypothetical protein
MTSFAVALQVYTLTHSSVTVGAVGLAAAVPAIVLGLLGGSIVDAADRRTDTISFAAALYGVARLSATPLRGKPGREPGCAALARD